MNKALKFLDEIVVAISDGTSKKYFFSIEERIDELITRKGELMEKVIGSDDHKVFKTFTREDIIELLQVVETS